MNVFLTYDPVSEIQLIKQTMCYIQLVLTWLIFVILMEFNLNKTYCNNIISIYETFGIEAARNILCKEYNRVFEAAGQYKLSAYEHIIRYYDK